MLEKWRLERVEDCTPRLLITDGSGKYGWRVSFGDVEPQFEPSGFLFHRDGYIKILG